MENTVTVEWYGPARGALLFTCHGRWSWQQMNEALRQSLQMLDTVQHKVVMVIDMRPNKGFPQGALSELRKINGNVEHDNWADGVVIIGANPFFRSIMDIFQRVKRTNKHVTTEFADDIPEMESLIVTVLERHASESA